MLRTALDAHRHNHSKRQGQPKHPSAGCHWEWSAVNRTRRPPPESASGAELDLSSRARFELEPTFPALHRTAKPPQENSPVKCPRWLPRPSARAVIPHVFRKWASMPGHSPAPLAPDGQLVVVRQTRTPWEGMCSPKRGGARRGHGFGLGRARMVSRASSHGGSLAVRCNAGKVGSSSNRARELKSSPGS